MKKLYFLLLVCLMFKLGNAQFIEQFTDGGFSNNPTWSGTSSSFAVNAAKELQLNGSTSGGTAYLVTANALARSVEFSIYVSMRFNPSDNDYIKIYLFSSVADLTASNQGYFLKIGRNGASDGLEFYRQDGTNEVLLKNMLVAQLSSNPDLDIKVIKNNLGKWVFYWKNAGASTFTAIDSLNENNYSTTNYFGMLSQYSSANFDKLYFDNISVIQLADVSADTIPPYISAIEVNNATHLTATFSEALSPIEAVNIANYSLSPSATIQSASIDPLNSNVIHLVLASPLSSNTAYTLSVNYVQDNASNVITQHNFNFNTAYFAQANDIYLNEIMAKPNPNHGLPSAQYIELKNNSASPIDLSGWAINGVTIPSGTLAPNGIIIICDQANVADFNAYGSTVPVASLPIITNTANLVSTDNIVIDSLTFDDTWYHSTSKQNGGWSLELVSQSYEVGCPKIAFWNAALNTNGGTPGSINHAYTSSTIQAQINRTSSSVIEVHFDGTLPVADLTNVSNYTIDNGLSIQSAVLTQSNPAIVTLTLSTALTSNTLYHITVKDIQGCAGLHHPEEIFETAITRKPLIGELLLNEVLHYPKTGTSDFVEIYNPSEFIFSLKDIAIAKEDAFSGNQVSTDFSSSTKYILPHGYLVATQNKVAIIQDYPVAVADNIVEGNLPDYGIKEDIVVLKNTDNIEIDRLHFTDKWHFPLLKTYQGVSLERTNDLANKEEKTNWKSAAESSGFATPGYINSTFTDISLDNNIHTKPEIFSPDQDGRDDEFVVEYNFDQDGNTGSLSFYNTSGQLVRSIVKNKILPKEGYFIWDGITDNGDKAKVGIYLMVFEVKDTDGNVKQSKQKCVVATRF